MDKTILAGEISGAPAIDGIENWCHGARHAPTRVEKGGNNKTGNDWAMSVTHSPTPSPRTGPETPPASSSRSPCLVRRDPDI